MSRTIADADKTSVELELSVNAVAPKCFLQSAFDSLGFLSQSSGLT